MWWFAQNGPKNMTATRSNTLIQSAHLSSARAAVPPSPVIFVHARYFCSWSVYLIFSCTCLFRGNGKRLVLWGDRAVEFDAGYVCQRGESTCSRNGGLLEGMKDIGVDVIGLDWRVDMADGRRRIGDGLSVQGNVDPAYLFSPLPVLTDEIHRVVKAAETKGHILYLGHGAVKKTPEEAVAHFFDVTRSLRYDTLFQFMLLKNCNLLPDEGQ